MNRREFTKKCMQIAFLSGVGSKIAFSEEINSKDRIMGLINKPKYFTISWVDPYIDVQKNQEFEVAKFPIAFVTQGVKKLDLAWKDKVRKLNPEIVFLAYQMVIEETTVPGPGHDRLRDIQNSFVTFPGGYEPTVTVHKTKKRRIYDPRSKEWQDGFLESCEKVFESYQYEGLFLDQCTVFEKAAPDKDVKKEMMSSLQETLLELRKKYPEKIIIANSRYNWKGLNGELNENRPRDYSKELLSFEGHQKPEMNFACLYRKEPLDMSEIYIEMAKVKKYGAWFTVCKNPQNIKWHNFYL